MNKEFKMPEKNKKQSLILEKQPGFFRDLASYASAGKSADVDPLKQEVPGLDTDDTGAAAGRAEYLLNNVKKRLERLGFDLDNLKSQKTIEQLLAGPFGITFSLFWPKKNEWGEKGKITNIAGIGEIDNPLDTRAKVKTPNANGGLILSLKAGFDVYFFDEKELRRTLGGGGGKLPPGKKGENLNRMLEEGVTYKVKIDKNIILSDGEEEEGDENQDQDKDKDVNIPEEIRSGKNRNEIFRLLLNNFGGYNGKVVYGDGFKTPEESREYGKLQRAVKSGKEEKSKLKEFRDKAKRDSYAMMISNLRKSYPTTFMSKLSKAFPEFNIKYTKESFNEFFVVPIISEEENVDKYKRWSLVFPSKVIGNGTIDNLDKNIKNFMAAVKKWFAVPVMGPDGKKRSYNISYDEDKVNSYWSKFYGTKKESKISLYNILSEMIKEENDEKGVKPDYVLLKIENGGLETQDEDREAVESRKQSGGKKSGTFVDALLVKAGKEFESNTGEISGTFELQPGFANLKGGGEKEASKEKSKARINIKYEKDKVTEGTIEIENNPSNINAVLNNVIKKGEMKIKLSLKDSKYIILYYPSTTSVGERVNNTWQEILKK